MKSSAHKFEINIDTTLYPDGKRRRNMLYIFNYNLKENKMKEFQKFIKENEKTFAEHAPK